MRLFKSIPVSISLALLLCSCINEEYDLKKDINLDMSIAEGEIELPLPLEPISVNLSELIDFDANNTITADADGYLSARMQAASGIGASYTLPEFPRVASISKSLDFKGIPASSYINGQFIPVTDLNRFGSFTAPISFEFGPVSEQITAVKSVSLKQTQIHMTFRINNGANIRFVKGSQIQLPNFVVLNESSLKYRIPHLGQTSFVSTNKHFTIGEDKHSIVFNEDIPLYAASGNVELVCEVKSLDLSACPIVNSTIALSGDMAFSTSGIYFVDNTQNSSFDIGFNVGIDEIIASSVTAKANPAVDVSIDPFSVSELADAFESVDAELEFADIAFSLNTMNTSPFDINISSWLVAQAGGKETHRINLCANNNFVIPASSSAVLTVSDSGNMGEEGETKIKVPGLASVLNPVPDTILMDGLTVNGQIPGDGFYEFKSGESFTIDADFLAVLPFTFKSASISTSLEYELGLDMGEVGLKSLELSAKVENSFPLGVDLTFVLLDSNKRPVPGIHIYGLDSDGNKLETINCPAGSHNAPISADIRILIESESVISSLDNISISLTAASPAGQTVSLNTNSSLTISDFVARTESGIRINASKE